MLQTFRSNSDSSWFIGLIGHQIQMSTFDPRAITNCQPWPSLFDLTVCNTRIPKLRCLDGSWVRTYDTLTHLSPLCFVTVVIRSDVCSENLCNYSTQVLSRVLSVCTWHTGVSGNVLINEKGHRLKSYDIWDYAEGHDAYYRSMLVDLTQPPDKVSDLRFPLFVRFTCGPWVFVAWN